MSDLFFASGYGRNAKRGKPRVDAVVKRDMPEVDSLERGCLAVFVSHGCSCYSSTRLAAQ